MKYYLIFSILFFVLTSNVTISQKREFGINLGYGHSNELDDFSKIDILYSYTPTEAPFSFKTGFSYDYFKNTNSNFSFGRIPVGLDFSLGNKVQFIVGAGLNSSILLNSNTDNQDFNASKTFIQIGYYTNIGLCVSLNSKYSILLQTQYHQDFTPLYFENRNTSIGKDYSVDVKLKSYFLSLGIKYKLE